MTTEKQNYPQPGNRQPRQ